VTAIITNPFRRTPFNQSNGQILSKHQKNLALPLLIASVVLNTVGCTSTTANNANKDLAELQNLKPCPATPNCVSSDAQDKLHQIEPLALGEDPALVWQALIRYLQNDRSYSIKVQQEDYIRAESRTLIFRFVDDVEFQLRPQQGIIAMRSASRVGLSDLGKNRRRLEKLRQTLRKTLLQIGPQTSD
jgi:uncharacterized protein (DUF1499 family)